MKKQLTERQYKFCMNYIESGNACESALYAGYRLSYAKARAHELVKHPTIQEYLNEARERTMEKFGMTYESKIKVLQQIINTFMNEPNQSLTPQHAKVIIQAISVLNNMEGHRAPDRKVSLTIDATKARLLEAQKVYEEY